MEWILESDVDVRRHKKTGEYVVYRCPDGSILTDWNRNTWKCGYPAYPRHRCVELERGICKGGKDLPRLYAKMRIKYGEKRSADSPVEGEKT